METDMTQEKVLIVEDEENERTGLAELVSAWGYRADTAMDGIERLSRIAEHPRTIAVIVVTAQGSAETGLEAGKLGAYSYIQKPIDPNRLRNLLEMAANQRATTMELEVTRRKLRDTGILGSLVGASRNMQEIFRLIEMVAPSTASVLITGRSE